MRSVDSFGAAALRGYPERDDIADAMGRFLVAMSTRFRRLLRLGFDDADSYFASLRRKAALDSEPLPAYLSRLRYRLRRSGCTDELIGDYLACLVRELGGKGIPLPPPVAFAAAAAQLRGGIAVVADDDLRGAALVLAACAAALGGDPVHVLVRSEARAAVLSEKLNVYLAPFGMRAAAIARSLDFRGRRKAYAAEVICGTPREVGLDYLRDRLELGERRGQLTDVASRLSGDAPVEDRLLLRGLYCAFVDDAEMLMIDDARLPLIISAEVDQSRERLLYEQALELARALKRARDFELTASGVVLTEVGRQRLELLVSPLGGIWAAQSRCEALVVIALRVLHEFMRDRDYQVVQGRVVFPTPRGKAGEERTEGDEVLQKLAEVKEGCALSGQRDVLARASVPRFLNRYLRLAGVASDADAVAAEFGSLYGMPVFGELAGRAITNPEARMFCTAQARLDALVHRITTVTQEGHAVIVALRSQLETQVVMEGLSAAGIPAAVLHGQGGNAEQAALAASGRPGAVTLSCYPAERSVSPVVPEVPVHLLVAEMHDAQRHVTRLCRVYAASTCESLLSLEDPVIQTLLPAGLAGWLERHADAGGELPPKWSSWLACYGQAALEREQRLLRDELRSREVYLNDVLAFSGRND